MSFWSDLWRTIRGEKKAPIKIDPEAQPVQREMGEEILDMGSGDYAAERRANLRAVEPVELREPEYDTISTGASRMVALDEVHPTEPEYDTQEAEYFAQSAGVENQPIELPDDVVEPEQHPEGLSKSVQRRRRTQMEAKAASELSKTGRKKRKDAGTKRGPRAKSSE